MSLPCSVIWLQSSQVPVQHYTVTLSTPDKFLVYSNQGMIWNGKQFFNVPYTGNFLLLHTKIFLHIPFHILISKHFLIGSNATHKSHLRNVRIPSKLVARKGKQPLAKVRVTLQNANFVLASCPNISWVINYVYVTIPADFFIFIAGEAFWRLTCKKRSNLLTANTLPRVEGWTWFKNLWS